LKIDIIAAALPPQLDGIGDYTANLASQLAQTEEIRILTEEGRTHDDIPGVTIEGAFLVSEPRTVLRLLERIEARRPDWVLLQYNPFSYGRRGINPYLPWMLHSLRRRCPATRIAVMVHEPYAWTDTWRLALMSAWHRAQLWMLGRAADVLFFSIEPWALKFRSWFPKTPLWHLPVGSNIPLVEIDRAEARRRLGIEDGTMVIGVFGTAHPSRMLYRVRSAVEEACRAGWSVLILHLGPDADLVRLQMRNLPLRADGPLPAEEVSRRFAAMDVHLIPFADGVSTRRTSLMTSLQHGVPTVATVGFWTDQILKDANEQALLLAGTQDQERFHQYTLRCLQDPALRESLGAGARRLYEQNFSWQVIGQQLLTRLTEHSRSAAGSAKRLV
jgi:glycosyltransferase involved in cell wall biosynthesis